MLRLVEVLNTVEELCIQRSFEVKIYVKIIKGSLLKKNATKLNFQGSNLSS